MALILLEYVHSFLKITLTSEVLWIVFPLFLATIVMVFYLEKYKGEKAGWNTHVGNSLVLLFVSMSLFRSIYNLGPQGAINFVLNPYEFVITTLLFLIGVALLFINFNHFLPEKIAGAISSPITVNVFAYVIIVAVYSDVKNSLLKYTSLLVLLFLLLFVFNLIRIPLERLFKKIEKMKEQEEIEDIADARKKIILQKNYLKKKEKEVKKEENKKIRKISSLRKKINNSKKNNR